MSFAFRLMLPMLRKQMEAKSPDKSPLMFCLFKLKKDSEDIFCFMEHKSGQRYKSQLDSENTFYDIMLKSSSEIKDDWELVTLLINFETKQATTTTYNKQVKPITTNTY